MTEVHSTRQTIIEGSVELLHTRETHSLLQLRGTHGHQFDGLHKVIAEPMIEVFLCLHQFLVALFRKAAGQVFPDYAMPVSQDLSHDEIQQIGQYVEQTHGQQ